MVERELARAWVGSRRDRVVRSASCWHLLVAEVNWMDSWRKRDVCQRMWGVRWSFSLLRFSGVHPYFRALAVVAICCAHVAKHS